MTIKVSNSKKKAVFSEINITPLTDIFLVLLIIMMVVAPTFQSNAGNIEIPEINSGLTVEEKSATVSITKEGDLFLNGTPITFEKLPQALVELKPNLSKQIVLVKADTAAKSRDIMQVMRAAKEAEYEKLTVAGEPLSKKEQGNLKKNAAKMNEQSIDASATVTKENSPKHPAVQKVEESHPFVNKPTNNTDWEE